MKVYIQAIVTILEEIVILIKDHSILPIPYEILNQPILLTLSRLLAYKIPNQFTPLALLGLLTYKMPKQPILSALLRIPIYKTSN